LKAVAARAGTPAEPGPPVARERGGEAERRQMTIMFCDMVGSTHLANRLDPEDMFTVIATYQRCCAEVIQRFGGHVAKYMGDGVLAYFGFPLAREDDAERAVRASLELVEAVRRLRPRPDVNLHARIGIDTGLVVIGDLLTSASEDEEMVVGDTPNLAARLQAIAPPDSVVIGDHTRRLLGELFACEDLGPREIKGFAGPQRAWRVLGEGQAEGRFEARSGAGLTPMIGREHELQLILQRWELARSGEGQVLLLSGEGGIGKSRLVDALSRELAGQAHVRLRYFCSQFYAGTALYPVIEQVKRAAGLLRGDSPEAQLDKLEALLVETGQDPQRAGALLATLCSVPAGERYPAQEMLPHERKQATFGMLVDMIEAASRMRPLLIQFEDVHWIDPTTSDFLTVLIDRVRNLAAMLAATFRPEFNPPWRRQPHLTLLQLNRFGRLQTIELIERVSGGRHLPGEVVELVLEKTDGVPLFVEELTKALLESGALTPDGDRFDLSGPLPLISIPSTLHDSLMARLDRLATVKEVALWASALGRSFTLDLLARVAPLPRAEIEQSLAKLVDAEMVYRHTFRNDEVYEFKHALVQEAAYLSMLRARRHQMHARIAAALEESFPETVAERPEILAHHFGEAGIIDKAYEYNLLAGDAAAARYASPEAHLRFAKAQALARMMPPGPRAQRRELKAILKCASVAAGGTQVEADLEALQHAEGLATELGHRPRLAQVLYWTGRLHYVAGRFDRAVEHAVRSLAIADELGDERQSAAAANLLARIHCLRGEPAQGIAYAERNAEQMGALGNRIEQAAITGVLAFALALAARFAEAQAAAARAVELAERLDHLPTQAACHFFRGVAHGWQGDLAVAEPSFATALDLADKAGDVFRRYVAHGWRGEARLHAGDVRGAVADLTACLELAQSIGSTFHRGAYQALLAEARLREGAIEAALELSAAAMALAERAQEAWSLSIALRTQAQVLLAGEPAAADEAIELLNRSAKLQADQELHCDLAWTRLALAEALDAAGQPAAARSELDAAGELLERAAMREALKRAAASRRRIRAPAA
jgi:class 3 adenylate cyclase/tetratricopeptide (TPR) repeat protein